MHQFNVYSLKWEYLGCYWSGGSQGMTLGDFRRTMYSGPLATKQGEEFDKIQTLEVYIKYMGEVK